MQYASLNRHIHVVMRGKEHVECRHWYWVRRLFGRRGFCRKCKEGHERIARELLRRMEADFKATFLSEPEPKQTQTTYGGGRMTKRFLVNIEGS